MRKRLGILKLFIASAMLFPLMVSRGADLGAKDFRNDDKPKPVRRITQIKFFHIPDPESFMDQQKLKVTGLKWYLTHPKAWLVSVAYCEGERGGITSLIYEPSGPAIPAPESA